MKGYSYPPYGEENAKKEGHYPQKHSLQTCRILTHDTMLSRTSIGEVRQTSLNRMTFIQNAPKADRCFLNCSVKSKAFETRRWSIQQALFSLMRCGKRKPPQGVTIFKLALCLAEDDPKKRIACLRYVYTIVGDVCQLIFTKNVHFLQNYLHFFRRGGLLKGASWSKPDFGFRK